MPQTPLWLLQKLHMHLGQGPFVTVPHPSFAISPIPGCLLFSFRPYLLRGALPSLQQGQSYHFLPCSAHPCHIKHIRPIQALVAPHYLAPPNLCKLISAASSLVSSQDGCALLPSLFHVRFQPRANSLPVNNPNLFLLPFLPQRPLPLPVSKSILCSVPSSPQLLPSVPTRL